LRKELDELNEKYEKENEDMQENMLNSQIMLNKKDEEIANLIEKIKKIDSKCVVSKTQIIIYIK